MVVPAAKGHRIRAAGEGCLPGQSAAVGAGVSLLLKPADTLDTMRHSAGRPSKVSYCVKSVSRKKRLRLALDKRKLSGVRTCATSTPRIAWSRFAPTWVSTSIDSRRLLWYAVKRVIGKVCSVRAAWPKTPNRVDLGFGRGGEGAIVDGAGRRRWVNPVAETPAER